MKAQVREARFLDGARRRLVADLPANRLVLEGKAVLRACSPAALSKTAIASLFNGTPRGVPFLV
jgi:hypothetical protein